MNGIKPTIGIEFDDPYAEAKNKLIDVVKALNSLTPPQRQQLAEEFISSAAMAASLEQFVRLMKNGGQV